MFTVTVEGEEEVKAAFERAYNEIRVGAVRGVGYGVRDGANEIRTKHKFRNRTGELERSVQGVVLGWRGDSEYVGVIRASAKHAGFVEYDTPPHLIPGNPFLAFEWKGEQVFFRYVNHRGTKAQPFMHLGYYKCERVILREMEISLKRAQEILDR